MVYLIDTSCWLFAFGKKPLAQIKERVQSVVENHQAAVTSPIVFEILRGIPEQEPFDRMLDYLSHLVRAPLDWVEAARWSSRPALRKLGVGAMDLFIAHTAIQHHMTLIHADHGFDRLAKVLPLKTESFAESVMRPPVS